ncbi:unannotated protein [freshwater metagenome]|uniref:Unannotated protein n=1 Tax=freshwater metagenome TaxID=449393 RepID=A0A6J6C6R3_9ZZZZ
MVTVKVCPEPAMVMGAPLRVVNGPTNLSGVMSDATTWYFKMLASLPVGSA